MPPRSREFNGDAAAAIRTIKKLAGVVGRGQPLQTEPLIAAIHAWERMQLPARVLIGELNGADEVLGLRISLETGRFVLPKVVEKPVMERQVDPSRIHVEAAPVLADRLLKAQKPKLDDRLRDFRFARHGATVPPQLITKRVSSRKRSKDRAVVIKDSVALRSVMLQEVKHAGDWDSAQRSGKTARIQLDSVDQLFNESEGFRQLYVPPQTMSIEPSGHEGVLLLTDNQPMRRFGQENLLLTDWEGSRSYTTRRAVGLDVHDYYVLHHVQLADLFGDDILTEAVLSGREPVPTELSNDLDEFIQARVTELISPVLTVVVGEQTFAEPIPQSRLGGRDI